MALFFGALVRGWVGVYAQAPVQMSALRWEPCTLGSGLSG